MKVIDLLNKIANGEEVPRKVRHGTLYWEYSEEYKDFKDNDGDWVFSCSNYSSVDMLNDEIEIIEEKENNKIKKIYECWTDTKNEDTKFLIKNINQLGNKVNELIDVINELRGKDES